MTSNRSKEWEKEFDNDFAGAICGGDGLVDSQLKNDIKDWFEGELDQQRAELIEKVEEYFGHIGNDGYGKPMRISQDEIAREVIQLLKGEK